MNLKIAELTKGKTGPFLTRHSCTPRGDALDEVKYYFVFWVFLLLLLVKIEDVYEGQNVIVILIFILHVRQCQVSCAAAAAATMLLRRKNW